MHKCFPIAAVFVCNIKTYKNLTNSSFLSHVHYLRVFDNNFMIMLVNIKWSIRFKSERSWKILATGFSSIHNHFLELLPNYSILMPCLDIKLISVNRNFPNSVWNVADDSGYPVQRCG
jgi:hypothetical protein